MKGVLYLDVDGVINPWGAPSTDWSDWERHEVRNRWGRFHLELSRELCAALVATGLEIRWLTTWGRMANEQVSPLVGWPTDMPVACEVEGCGAGHVAGRGLHVSDAWFKLEHIAAVATHPSHPPFAWVDDELSDHHRGNAVMDRLANLQTPRMMTVAPVTATGLTRYGVEAIQRFADSL